MNELPGRSVEPLSPPPGAFEQVRRRAHARRVRTGLLASATALVVAVGGVGAGLAVDGEGGRESLATRPTSTPSVPPSASPPAATRTPVPTVTPPPTAGSSPRPADPPADPLVPVAPPPVPPSPDTPPSAAPSPTAATATGRAVDTAGRPLAGLHVTLWSPGNALPDEHDAFTGPDGRYTVRCGGKALLVDWMLGGPQYPSTRNLAATWVGGGSTLADAPPLPCGGDEQVTVLRPGAVLEGTYRGADGGGALPLPGGPLDAGLSCLPLGTYDGRAPTQPTCVELTAEGGRYRLVGLPTGTYVLRTATGEATVELVAGRTTTRDLDDCTGCPPP